jgi:Sigma-70 region 2
MENISGISGYVASTLVLLTFVAKDMRLLRTIAIFSNLAFIIYGTIEWLPPVLYLHLVLLPLNIVRLREIVRANQATGDLTQAEGAVGEPLCTGVTSRRRSPVAHRPIFLSMPKTARPT